MEIKFPEQENPFPKTMIQAIISAIAALAIGLFLGNALGAFVGTDESVINTSTYTDRMSAIRTVFTDGDQLDSFSRTALALRDREGLKILTSRGKTGALALENGERSDAYQVFDEDIRRSLTELMNTEEALYGVETAAGNPITDVWLRNIAVADGVVYYYLYYDEAGFAGVAYDPGGTVLGSSQYALPLTQTQATSSKEAQVEWFIIYDMGDT